MSPAARRDGYLSISEYALIGDTHSCALISRHGSVDWACFPRFDSGSVFGRLLDARGGGHFSLNPTSDYEVRRRYVPGTMVLETTFTTPTGEAVLHDFMPVHDHASPAHPYEIFEDQQIARVLRCTSGYVQFEAVCRPRFQYGAITPHAYLLADNIGYAHGGIDAIAFHSPSAITLEDDTFHTSIGLSEGESAEFSSLYTYHREYHPDTHSCHDLDVKLQGAIDYWKGWSSQFSYDGPFREEALRSALTLKALTYSPTGGLVAAATTSLPEELGGVRNWDYRYTWIRDTAFALYALNVVGFVEEAKAFRGWLVRATAGRARDLQVLYGLAGERRLTEEELDHLDGYRGSRPVRIGNGAAGQLQLDIYGEVMDSAYLYRKYVGPFAEEDWEFYRRVAEFVMDHWREPDEGIWETRGGRKHFVFSKVMCWVALDRGVRVESARGGDGELIATWKQAREEIRRDVLEKGYDDDLGAFVQAYDSRVLDAAVLMLPLVGFIKARDPRMRSTIERIAEELTSPEGLVYRYRGYDDGLTGGEGTFSICTFWLADNLIYLGELDRAEALMQKMCGYANDVGLLSEQIDGESGELLGNFPQAFTHMAVINTAVQLAKAKARRAAP